jgi:sugar/nucleoside kinase (ribokinase family)
MTNHSSAQPVRDSRFEVTQVGDTDLDILIYGPPKNLLPERELLADCSAVRLGWSSAITARNLAALDNSVSFITSFNADEFGRRCQSGPSNTGV